MVWRIQLFFFKPYDEGFLWNVSNKNATPIFITDIPAVISRQPGK